MSRAISLNTRRIAFLVSVWALSGPVGCSNNGVSPGGNPPTGNQPPEVTFTFAPRAVVRSNPTDRRHVTLTVTVTDPDEDPVTVHWAVTRNGQPSGVLNAAQQGQPSIQWETPTQTGTDTITVTASDGKDGGATTLTETVEVGTLKDTRIETVPETWNAADSPFIIRPIEDDFVIDERMMLTVEAGSELLIDRVGMVISVVGTLEADGTAERPVIIRPNTRATEPGAWEGITANPSGLPPVVRLTHTHVLYATAAVQSNTTAEVYLDGCLIARSSDAAVLHSSSGPLVVKNSSITNNVNSGIKIHKLAKPLPTMVEISGDTIAWNGDLTGKTPYVDQAAVYISLPDSLATSAITLNGNDIYFNGVPGIQLVGACFPIMNYNTIYANELGKTGTRYNIKLDNGFAGAHDTIDATSNYWGGAYPPATGEALIKEMIRDSEDSGTIKVRVLVTPWLDVEP
jgi:hypothetical protein